MLNVTISLADQLSCSRPIPGQYQAYFHKIAWPTLLLPACWGGYKSLEKTAVPQDLNLYQTRFCGWKMFSIDTEFPGNRWCTHHCVKCPTIHRANLHPLIHDLIVTTIWPDKREEDKWTGRPELAERSAGHATAWMHTLDGIFQDESKMRLKNYHFWYSTIN